MGGYVGCAARQGREEEVAGEVRGAAGAARLFIGRERRWSGRARGARAAGGNGSLGKSLGVATTPQAGGVNGGRRNSGGVIALLRPADGTRRTAALWRTGSRPALSGSDGGAEVMRQRRRSKWPLQQCGAGDVTRWAARQQRPWVSDRRCAARACGDVRRALAGEAAGDGMARA
jgi:hypothetical protein